MGSVNYGNQQIRYNYQQSATSKSFNELNYNITPSGIHEGGVLSFVSASPGTINIDAMKIVINDVSNKVSMTVETTDTITLTTGSPDSSIYIDSTHPYIVARFVWVNALNNFMDIKTVAYASILEGDIILGKCIYVGGVLQNAFDYTRRVTSSIKILDNKKDFFRVQNTEPPSNKVHVLGGTIKTSSGLVDISSADSPVISNTISNGRNDYIYLNNSGAILVQEGVESASPVTPDYESRLVLAEIHRAAGKNLINGSDIFQIFGEYDETNLTWLGQDLRETASPTFNGLTVNGSIDADGDLNLHGVVNADRKIEFASDANLLWDENEDEFIINKQMEINGLNIGGNSIGGSQVVVALGTWVVPVGIYTVVVLGISEIRIEVQVSSTWRWGEYFRGGVIISDGTNVRFQNLSGSNSETLYYRKF